MSAFKVAALWCQWTPQIKTRIVRDVLALQRLANVKKTQLIIACDPELHAQLTSIGVGVTSDLTGSDIWRVYALSQEQLDPVTLDRIPDDAEDIENVFLSGGSLPPDPAVHQKHPYDGVDLKEDWYTIPETMPLDQPAPLSKEPDNYSLNPFL